MKRLISLVVICVLLLGLCACNTIGGANSKTNIKVADSNSTYRVGDTVQIRNVEIAFVNVNKTTGPDGAVYLNCEFEIANKTTEALSISAILSFSGFCDGYACSISLDEDTANSASLNGSIAVGSTVKGTVTYKVAPDWKELQIHFKPYVLRDETVIFVVPNS